MLAGIAFILIAGLFEGVMDLITFKYSDSKFIKGHWFFDSNTSWKNKWKNVVRQDKAPWYYFGLHKPQFSEAFPYSSTILVGLTDGWHMFKLLRNVCLFIGVSFLAGAWWAGVVAYALNRVGFMLGHYKIFRK
jgi:hypothetical protein